MLANLNRVQAQEKLHAGSYNPTDWKGVHDLYLAAFGDEELARRAQTEALKAYVEACCRGNKTTTA